MQCTLKPMMVKPDLENTSITPPGRRFGNLKLSGLIRTSVFSTCASAGKRIGSRHDRVRVALRQFRARSKHASPDEIESRAGNQPANDAAGARFAHRVRRDDDIGKLFSLHFDYLSGGL